MSKNQPDASLQVVDGDHVRGQRAAPMTIRCAKSIHTLRTLPKQPRLYTRWELPRRSG
jgi:hypothetical protein